MQTLYIIYDPKDKKILYQTYNEIMAKHKMITYLLEKIKPVLIEIDKSKITSDSFYILYNIKESEIITIEKYINEIFDYMRMNNIKKYCFENCQLIKIHSRKEF